jgi:hypothetical protein
MGRCNLFVALNACQSIGGTISPEQMVHASDEEGSMT